LATPVSSELLQKDRKTYEEELGMPELLSEYQPPPEFKIGMSLYLAALPEQVDPAAFYHFTQVWQNLEFDQKTGPFYDEANKLQRSWWHEGSAAAREACLNATRALGQVLGFPPPVAAS
jgi:hypothetical protein